MKVSLKDIANKSGVSIGCVSRVLNADSSLNITEETRQRVMRTSQTLGYKSHSRKRNEFTRCNQVYLILLSSSERPNVMDDAEIGRMIRNVGIILGKYFGDLELVVKYLEITNTEIDKISVITDQFKNSAGAIIYGSDYNSLLIKELSSKTPTVVIDYYDKKKKLNCVVSSDEDGAFNAVNYLLSLGHKKIACVYQDLQTPAGHDRKNGFVKAMQKAGIKTPDKWIIPEFPEEFFAEKISDLLSEKNSPTAFFCTHDIPAAKVRQAAINIGYAVPDDISIVGFSNSEQHQGLRMHHLSAFFTTVDCHFEEMIKTAANMLLEIISGHIKKPEKRVIHSELIVRRSSAPPKRQNNEAVA